MGRYSILAVLIAFAALAIILRLHYVQMGYQGFAQPDSYLYYAMATHTLANNPAIPSLFDHSPYTEGPLLVYQAIALYPLLGSVYASMLAMPLIYAVAAVFLIYLFARFFVAWPYAAMASLLYAFTPIAIQGTSSMQWRGDGFVPILALGISYLIMRLVYTDSSRAVNLVGAALLMVAAYFMWNGGGYVGGMAAAIALFYMFEAKLHRRFAAIAMLVLIPVSFAVGSVIMTNLVFFLAPSHSGLLASIAELQSPSLTSWLVDFGFLSLFAMAGVVLVVFDRGMDSVAASVLLGMAFLTVPMALLAVRWASLAYIPMIVLSVYALERFVRFGAHVKGLAPWVPWAARFGAVVLLTTQLLLGIGVSASYPSAYPLHADPYTQWISADTAPNATFLTLWQDGSQIEGWAGRASYTDSMQGQNASRIADFSRFLFDTDPNMSYLAHVKPDYLVVFSYWRNFTSGIAEEGNLSSNTTYNGTNLQMLEHCANLPNLTVAYNESGVCIYRYASS